MRVKVDGFELLIAMTIVALGEFNGVQFEYFPILQKPFCDNLDFQSSCGCNADFLCIRVNGLFKVDVWLSQLFFVPLHRDNIKTDSYEKTCNFEFRRRNGGDISYQI